MGWFDGWPFKSKEQMERERREFENRVFPLGQEQREAALAILRAGLAAKLKDEEKLFAFISTKDAYVLNGGEDGSGVQRAEKTLQNQKWLSEADRRFLFAFVKLEAAAESLSDYPTLEAVKRSELLEFGGNE